MGLTWPIFYTTTSNNWIWDLAEITQNLGKLCNRKVSKSKQARLDDNNFMHSIIDETFKYLFSLFGQGLASEYSHPNSRTITLPFISASMLLQNALLTK